MVIWIAYQNTANQSDAEDIASESIYKAYHGSICLMMKNA